jgi:periplasmic divalent cation tolerance protein
LSTVRAVSVYIVAADTAEAERIAEALVAERLAACVNILGGVRSVYRWQGAVERADEVAMIAKTTEVLFDPLAARVRALHSYDTPAIVAWPIVAGDAAYLDWIGAETGEG